MLRRILSMYQSQLYKTDYEEAILLYEAILEVQQKSSAMNWERRHSGGSWFVDQMIAEGMTINEQKVMLYLFSPSTPNEIRRYVRRQKPFFESDSVAKTAILLAILAILFALNILFKAL